MYYYSNDGMQIKMQYMWHANNLLFPIVQCLKYILNMFMGDIFTAELSFKCDALDVYVYCGSVSYY